MFGVPRTLKFRLQISGWFKAVFADQAVQSFSKQQVELNAHRIESFAEGAILPPDARDGLELCRIDVDTPANPAGFRPRPRYTKQPTNELMQWCPLRTMEK